MASNDAFGAGGGAGFPSAGAGTPPWAFCCGAVAGVSGSSTSSWTRWRAASRFDLGHEGLNLAAAGDQPQNLPLLALGSFLVLVHLTKLPLEQGDALFHAGKLGNPVLLPTEAQPRGQHQARNSSMATAAPTAIGRPISTCSRSLGETGWSPPEDWSWQQTLPLEELIATCHAISPELLQQAQLHGWRHGGKSGLHFETDRGYPARWFSLSPRNARLRATEEGTKRGDCFRSSCRALMRANACGSRATPLSLRMCPPPAPG